MSILKELDGAIKDSGKSFTEAIERAEQEGRVVQAEVIKISTRSPISRSVWIQLPKDVRNVLENEHGYKHFNPEADTIESDDKFL